jgi:predicted TIM-barrel fold metal-dependent hydrolase
MSEPQVIALEHACAALLRDGARADRILFSVDYPSVLNAPGVKWMQDVPLGPEDRAKILSGNARRLLRI